MSVDAFAKAYRYHRTKPFSLIRNVSRDLEPKGACGTFAWSALHIETGGKPWQAILTGKAMLWRCWSPVNGKVPRHAALWVRGKGWIDSTVREWRPKPEPHRKAWPVGFPVLAILAALFWASPLRADTSRMSLEGPTGTCFAVVVIENRYGVYIRDEVLDTPRGPVVMRYVTVGGHNATDADQVDVVSLPDGVMADPMHLDLPDGQTGRVCLMEWLGG
jgi:hypothetical protein